MTNMAAGYPVTFDVEPQLTGRNRLTVGFRIILAIPHLLLVGGPAIAIGGSFGFDDGLGGWSGGLGGGVIGAVAGVCAIIAWFAILFANRHPRGLWDLAHFYMRWRVKSMAYAAMLRDEYPPFGDGDYPVSFAVAFPDIPRDKLSVALRIFYLIPHFIVLFFLGIAWSVVSIIAWFAILFTGSYPEGMYNFSAGVMRWNVRVETYALLMRDEYPPFSMQP